TNPCHLPAMPVPCRLISSPPQGDGPGVRSIGGRTMTYIAARASGWQALYERRLVSMAEAAARVPPNAQVYMPVGQQVHALVRALVARGDELTGMTVTGLPAIDYGWFTPELQGRLTVNVVYANQFTRDALDRGIADYTPFMIYGHHKG